MEWYVITSVGILSVGLIVGLALMFRRSYRIVNLAAEQYKKRVDSYSGVVEDDPEEEENEEDVTGGFGLGNLIGVTIAVITITAILPSVMEGLSAAQGNVTGVGETIFPIANSGVTPVNVTLIFVIALLGGVAYGITSYLNNEGGG